MKLCFDGCDWNKARDAYQFSQKFDDWWAVELKQRANQSKAFDQKHGKNWELAVAFRARKRIKKFQITGPFVTRSCKQRQWIIELPSFRFASANPKRYVPLLRQFLEGFAIVLEREQIDASKIATDSELLLKRFSSQSGMLISEEDQDPGLSQVPFDLLDYLSRTAKRPTKKRMPAWKIPKSFQKLVEEEGEWVTDRFTPLRLLVMTGTKGRGRKSPFDWQLELDIDLNDKHYASTAKKIKAMGNEPDGEGWTELIEREFTKRHPKLAREFDSDSEMATCVVSVKSEESCKKLLELIWSLIYPK